MISAHRLIFGIIATLLLPLLLTIPAQANNAIYIESVKKINSIVHFEDEAMISIIQSYSAISIPCCSKTQQLRYLFQDLMVQKWGVSITEYTDLVKLLFSFESDAYQQQNQQEFLANVNRIDNFRRQVNQLVRHYHPGTQINAERLRQRYTGDSIVIAIFDLFDNELLKKQRQQYQLSTITNILSFGNPVENMHGNLVVDTVLSIAPEAKIIPISADSKNYLNAFQAIKNNPEVSIVNMSRTFAIKNDKPDPEFESLLHEILKTKLVIKSLGNTGSDLFNHLSPVRKKNNLPALGNLFSYDLKLIRSYLRQWPDESSLIFAINFNLLNEDTSLTATIPGNINAAIERSLSVVADGIFMPSSDNYESGSSFAAPQISGLSALLWQHLIKQGVNSSKIPKLISTALLSRAHQKKELPSFVQGKGLVNGDLALAYFEEP